MTWNLDDEDFNKESSGGGDFKIFNNGKAGESEATISLVKKEASDSSGGPDYKIVYTDAEGASINEAYWCDEPDIDWKIKKRRDGIRNMRHLIKTVLGPTALAQLPKTVATNKEAVEVHINLMKAQGMEGKKVVVFANYGPTGAKRAGKYLEPRCWPPFVRNIGQGDPIEASDNDQMERIVPDTVSGAATPAAVDDWN
jgi:hypothetical protein